MNQKFLEGFEKVAKVSESTNSTNSLIAGIKGTAGGGLSSILAATALVSPAIQGSIPSSAIKPLMYGALGTGAYLANSGDEANSSAAVGSALGAMGGWRLGQGLAKKILLEKKRAAGRLAILASIGATVAGGALGHSITKSVAGPLQEGRKELVEKLKSE